MAILSEDLAIRDATMRFGHPVRAKKICVNYLQALDKRISLSGQVVVGQQSEGAPPLIKPLTSLVEVKKGGRLADYASITWAQEDE